MKHTSLSPNISLSFIVAFALFLSITSIALAQTNLQPRPGGVDTSNVRSEERVEFTSDGVPVPVRIENTRKVRTNAVQIERTNVDVKAARLQRDSSATNTPQSFLEKARTILEEKRQGSVRTQNSGERTLTQEDKKQERIASFLSKVKRKMDAATARLIKLAERIESRIVKFEERDVDMTEAKRLLEEAKDSISSATQSVENAFENAREALASDVSRNAFGSVVSELKEAKESLRSAHKSLVEVIRIMKANLPEKDTDTKVETQETDTSDTETN